MKKNSFLIEALLILVGPLGAYFGYYPNITCKPSQAGFWFIMALGISIGVALTQLAHRVSDKKKQKHLAVDKTE